MFPLANFTMALVGTNIEKCDMPFVTEFFLLRLYETIRQRMYKILTGGIPPVNPKAYGGQHLEGIHNFLNGVIPGDDPFRDNQLI